MKNNYDNIARYYDRLSRIIFRRSIIKAQRCLLSYINEHNAVLIAGGRTGWILEEIARIWPAGLEITYVEVSAAMITLSQKRNYKANKVHFVHQPIETFISSESYDVILTPFLFDNFNAENASLVFDKLHQVLKVGGYWLFADFLPGSKLWQKLLLKTMYAFFRLFSNIEASALNDMEELFRRRYYQLITEEFHYGRFIWSAVYRKEL